MKKYQQIINKLERHLMQTLKILGEMEQEPSLKFCQEEAKTMTSILKSLESLRQVKFEMKNEAEQKEQGEDQKDDLRALRDELKMRLSKLDAP